MQAARALARVTFLSAPALIGLLYCTRVLPRLTSAPTGVARLWLAPDRRRRTGGGGRRGHGTRGRGQSALARALLGLYSLKSGRVLLDGRPLGDIPVAERATRIGYLPQEPWLFSGTIRDSILLGSAT
jgi:hypothetical protein